MPDEETATRQAKPAYVHTLSLRLSDADYRRLRRFVASAEDRSGGRLTHQSIMEAALRRFLDEKDRGGS